MIVGHGEPNFNNLAPGTWDEVNKPVLIIRPPGFYFVDSTGGQISLFNYLIIINTNANNSNKLNQNYIP